MTHAAPPGAKSLVQKRLQDRLRSIVELDEADLRELEQLPVTIRPIQAGRDVVRQGERTSDSLILVEGILYRHKAARPGERQIIAFHVPGDIPDLQTLHLPVMDHTLSAVTDCKIGAVPHAALKKMAAEHERLNAALWREALIDAAKFREWIVNLGSRTALQRTAHLFCELYLRMSAVGLSQNGQIAMPITQTLLCEALGMSAVHMNRTVRTLRADKLVMLDRRHMKILDWEKLAQLADFDAAYLHMR